MQLLDRAGLGYKPDREEVLTTVLVLIIAVPAFYATFVTVVGLLFGIRLWPLPSPSG
jgi:hypothetical protein